MARGNDRHAALADLRTSFGDTAGNASELIDMHRASVPPAVRQASANPVDEEATGNLDLKKIAQKFHGVTVRSASVRGPYVVAVLESPSGRVYKDSFVHDDSVNVPVEDAEEAALHANVMATHELRLVQAEKQRWIDEAVAKFRADLEAEAAEALSGTAEALQEQAQERAEEAAEAQDKADEGDAGGGVAVGVGDAADAARAGGTSLQRQGADDPNAAADDASDGSDEGEPKWPRTHDALDKLAKKNKVTFGENETKVEDKIAALQKAGAEPE